MQIPPTRCRAAAAVAFIVWCAAVGAVHAETLSRADYRAHQRQIEADYRADQAGCQRRSGQDRDLCLVQAQGRFKVAMAELDYNSSGKEVDAARLALAKRDSDRAVARQRCDAAPSRPERERCLAQADAAYGAPAIRSRTKPLRKY